MNTSHSLTDLTVQSFSRYCSQLLDYNHIKWSPHRIVNSRGFAESRGLPRIQDSFAEAFLRERICCHMISPEHVVIPANSASKRGSNLTSCCGSCSSASIPEKTRDERSRSLDLKIEKASSGPRQQSPCPIPEGDVWANRQPLWSLVTHTHLAVITRGESHCLGGQTGLSRNRSHPGAAAVRCDGTTTVHIRRAAEGTEKGWEPLITLLMPLGKLPDTPSIKTAHPGKMANDKQPTVRPHDSKMIPDAGGAMAVQTGAGLSATRWGTGWKWQRIPHQRACTHTHTHTLSLSFCHGYQGNPTWVIKSQGGLAEWREAFVC